MTDAAELPRLGRSLALAYEANPLVRWMFAEDLSFPRLEGLFTSLAEFGLRYGLVYASAEGVGAAIWFPPIGDERFSSDQPAPDVAADTAEWSSGRRGAALEALASNRPAEPHFYLDAVGVVPTCRRRGMASELLEPALAECDANAIGAIWRTRILTTLPFTFVTGSRRWIRSPCRKVLHQSPRCGGRPSSLDLSLRNPNRILQRQTPRRQSVFIERRSGVSGEVLPR